MDVCAYICKGRKIDGDIFLATCQYYLFFFFKVQFTWKYSVRFNIINTISLCLLADSCMLWGTVE